ncbi:hypothetical protein [Pedobacter sp.]|uniref:hypothetical protein n=1 Tax=Pedobacter sp. TaxID=1411316 RepID=UPI003C5B7C8A
MGISEKQLEDTIFFQLFQNVKDTGLDIYEHDKVFRQLSLGSYGTPDLLGFSFLEEEGKLKEVYITIYELKRGHVSFEAICQVQKYRYAMGEMFINNPVYKDVEIDIETALIGSTIDSSVDFMAASAEMRIRLYSYESTHRGIEFTRILNYNYKPDTYEKTWYGESKHLNLFKLFDGRQDVKYDAVKNESWISHQ